MRTLICENAIASRERNTAEGKIASAGTHTEHAGHEHTHGESCGHADDELRALLETAGLQQVQVTRVDDAYQLAAGVRAADPTGDTDNAPAERLRDDVHG
ncbi:hypothetical protein [Nocardia pseudobrasiliensis]|uniref:Uncharacterized protein n=1 Tax=Nocardia pseudobrasiliensis TaxID=45979 RepID=A0A370HSQ2_9NOCA|nr:hypothetical protein [Nocardia pseudobrasiliensis]RDI61330.1 hypothetical protein DFR76_11455 [Nocardia pseudobrasiliensis]